MSLDLPSLLLLLANVSSADGCYDMTRFGWFVGHLTLLFTTLRYGLSYITFHPYSRWARFSYRTAFVAAAVTYGIVVYKAFRARARAGGRQQGGALAFVADENVQYLGMLFLALGEDGLVFADAICPL